MDFRKAAGNAGKQFKGLMPFQSCNISVTSFIGRQWEFFNAFWVSLSGTKTGVLSGRSENSFASRHSRDLGFNPICLRK
jgi:hypothetical protein